MKKILIFGLSFILSSFAHAQLEPNFVIHMARNFDQCAEDICRHFNIDDPGACVRVGEEVVFLYYAPRMVKLEYFSRLGCVETVLPVYQAAGCQPSSRSRELNNKL